MTDDRFTYLADLIAGLISQAHLAMPGIEGRGLGAVLLAFVLIAFLLRPPPAAGLAAFSALIRRRGR